MTAWVLALALVAGPALALGLGPIEVRSQRDQPLLAEIAVVSNDPSELDRLQARLASPETFARIGLQPPQGIVSDLKFALALDAAGRPVIRVTSAVPVQQPLLTFLIEVDWGQGRLVREYSALLDAPRTVAAPSQPPIQAPVLQPSNTIVRPAVAASPPPAPEPAVDASPDATAAGPANPAAGAIPVPTAVPADTVAAQPAPDAVAPTPPPPAAPTGTARPVSVAEPQARDEYGPVKAGDTLGAIAAGMRAEGETLEQAMVGLLRANPEAFIAGNVNLVKQGAVLRLPADAERSQYSAAEAAAVVRMQIGEWRAMRSPVAQPDAVVEPAAGSGPATAATPTPAAATAGRVPGQSVPRADGARLEIVPPSQGSGQRAGTRSGIDAGGEGDMLRQELMQRDEALAARGAEVEELKARVADLERLQSQQQQLIQLKDSELAAAQQRLAASAARADTATSVAAGQAPVAQSNGSALLPWIGGALVLAGLLAWWLLRRGRAPRPATPVFDTATLAAAVPSRTGEESSATAGPPAEPAPVAAAPLRTPARVQPAMPAVAPTWHAAGDAAGASLAGGARDVEPASPPARGNGFADVPLAAAGSSPDAVPVAPTSASAGVGAGSGPDRLELARAYIDLGDTATARGLLLELTASDDPRAREDAARLLRDLG